MNIVLTFDVRCCVFNISFETMRINSNIDTKVAAIRGSNRRGLS
jgi:hypothetical protein